MTKQPGEEGSSRGLTLSLMVDHCLLFHPDQLAQIENNLPAYTVGSLTSKIRVEGLLALLEQVITSDEPIERFKEFAMTLENEVVALRISKKHMVSRELGNLDPSPALKYRRAA